MQTYPYETVSDRLKKIRLEKNISQDYLAKKLGISQKAYSKIENNETRLNVDVLQKLSDIMETPIESFFNPSHQPTLNDFSTRTGGDNVIYKNNSIDKIETLYENLLLSKDDVISAKIGEIESLKLVIKKLEELLHRK
jgi:transcriptional regulator with XRE-family HTH domain